MNYPHPPLHVFRTAAHDLCAFFVVAWLLQNLYWTLQRFLHALVPCRDGLGICG